MSQYLIKRKCDNSYFRGQYSDLIDPKDQSKVVFRYLFTSYQNACARFLNKKSALEILRNIRSEAESGDTYALVKLKEKPKNTYVYPKIGTVFLDWGVTIKGVTVAHIVECSEEDSQSLHTYDVSMGKGVWGNLNEYYRYLYSGDIEVIWEPKS